MASLPEIFVHLALETTEIMHISAYYTMAGVTVASIVVVAPTAPAPAVRRNGERLRAALRFRLQLREGDTLSVVEGTQQEIVTRLVAHEPPIPTQHGWTLVMAQDAAV